METNAIGAVKHGAYESFSYSGNPGIGKTRRAVVDSLKLGKSHVAIGLVVGLVLGASSPAFPAPVISNIAAVKTAVTGDVVTVVCRGSATARKHSCYDRHRDYMARIDVVVPANRSQGGGCFIVTDKTRGFRHWSPSC